MQIGVLLTVLLLDFFESTAEDGFELDVVGVVDVYLVGEGLVEVDKRLVEVDEGLVVVDVQVDGGLVVVDVQVVVIGEWLDAGGDVEMGVIGWDVDVGGLVTGI